MIEGKDKRYKPMPTKKQLEQDMLTLFQDQIAEKYGTTRVTVNRWRKEYGLFKKRN